jgi:hypothetical protein
MIFNIPLQRLMLYCLLLCLVPLGIAFMYLLSEQRQLVQLENLLTSVQYSVSQHEVKQAQNKAVREHYLDADHFYIDKNLETLSFLEDEVDTLQKLTSNTGIGKIESLIKRLTFLTTTNRLQFIEGAVQTYPYFQETTETLAHPVEVNLDDIKKILSKTEGIKIGPYEPGAASPQLIITDFKIEKKQIREGSDVFVLHMKLIKREYP